MASLLRFSFVPRKGIRPVLRYIIDMSQSFDIEPLFRAHYRALCLFALHYVGDVAVAEDVVMDCFVRLYERSAVEASSVLYTKSYLYQMVRNASIDHLRRKAAEAAVVETGQSPDAVGDVADTSVEDEELLVERSQREARLWKAIDALPQACRNILLMSKRDGLKNREIAETLGLSLKTVEAQLTKAYATLRGKAHEIYMLFF